MCRIVSVSNGYTFWVYPRVLLAALVMITACYFLRNFGSITVVKKIISPMLTIMVPTIEINITKRIFAGVSSGSPSAV